MGVFSDELQRLRVAATSPDGTVILRLCGDGDIQVWFARGSLSRHSEESLGRQVSAAVGEVIAARARAYERALRVLTGGRDGSPW